MQSVEAAPGKPLAPANQLAANFQLAPVDVLIFSPHPDDEVLGCGGIVRQETAAGKKVRVVFSTYGDAYAEAAAKLFNKAEATLGTGDYLNLAKVRAQEALDADRDLGVDPDNVIFLGYPDGLLERVAGNATGTPVTSPFTGRSATYATVVSDYHSRVHGYPGAYERASVIDDMVDILQQSRPARVYVADKADAHPDHRATGELVHAALTAIRYQGTLHTFLVHSAGHPDQWPWPAGPTPLLPIREHTADNVTYPVGVTWPPSERVPLTVDQVASKLHALKEYRSQFVQPSDNDLLGAFIKSEEIFWTGR